LIVVYFKIRILKYNVLKYSKWLPPVAFWQLQLQSATNWFFSRGYVPDPTGEFRALPQDP